MARWRPLELGWMNSFWLCFLLIQACPPGEGAARALGLIPGLIQGSTVVWGQVSASVTSQGELCAPLPHSPVQRPYAGNRRLV